MKKIFALMLALCMIFALTACGGSSSSSAPAAAPAAEPASEPAADSPAAPPELLAKALWLVPGVAFDPACHRLGRGKGVYDRLLAQGAGKTIGIFYELQRCPVLPCEPTDMPLGAVVTESGLSGCNNTVRS